MANIAQNAAHVLQIRMTQCQVGRSGVKVVQRVRMGPTRLVWATKPVRHALLLMGELGPNAAAVPLTRMILSLEVLLKALGALHAQQGSIRLDLATWPAQTVWQLLASIYLNAVHVALTRRTQGLVVTPSHLVANRAHRVSMRWGGGTLSARTAPSLTASTILSAVYVRQILKKQNLEEISSALVVSLVLVALTMVTYKQWVMATKLVHLDYAYYTSILDSCTYVQNIACSPMIIVITSRFLTQFSC